MTTATSSCPSGSTPEPARAPYRVRRLELADVRVWGRGTLELPDGLIALTGPNGAGKTSVIEAVVLACLGVSPRTAREAEIVRAGASALWIGLDLDGPTGTTRREIGFAAGRGRRLRRDGEAVRSLADWRERGAVLVFLPDELRAVKGPPAARRRHLDRLLEAAAPGYADDLAAYQAALSQRNALLRRIRAGTGRGPLEPWEHALAEHGARVAVARRRAVDELTPRFARLLARLGGGDGGALALETSPGDLAETPDDEVRDHLSDLFARGRERDLGAAQTLRGPHRDDLAIARGETDLRRLGSQGEQRLAALALILAHREHLGARRALPVLLMDDVLSELDPMRRERLLGQLGGAGQAVVTSADPDAGAAAARVGAAEIRVAEGVLTP